jgi:hypothetical protein
VSRTTVAATACAVCVSSGTCRGGICTRRGSHGGGRNGGGGGGGGGVRIRHGGG